MKHWEKFKWYIISGGVLLLLFFLYIFNLHNHFSKDLNKWLFKKKKDIVKKQVDRIKQKDKVIDIEVEKIDQKIKKIDQKIEDDQEEISNLDMEEVNEAWKSLGF